LAPQLDFTGRLVRGSTKFFATQLLGFAIVFAGAMAAQQTTLARLSHESGTELTRPSIGSAWTAPHTPHSAQPASLPESVVSRHAANALFVRSDLDRARTLSEQELRRNPRDTEALFVRMEVAGMELDAATTLDAALRLCELGDASPGDPRIQLAAMRLREAAANTLPFRAVVPRVKAVLASSQQAWPDLHAALLQAAMDGTAGLDPYAIARASGILTDWRIVGPLEHRPLDLDDSISSADDLSHPFYQNRAVENFQFPDGRIILPDYLSHHGTFYAAAHFGSLTSAAWRVEAEGASNLEIYIDGKPVLKGSNATGGKSGIFQAGPGPHRVVVKFTRAATPLRVAITPPLDQERPPLPPGLSAQELAYLLAAGHYAQGDFENAARQIGAVSSANSSAALEFLLAQSAKAGTPQSLTAWESLHVQAPAALAADNALARRALMNHDTATALRLAKQVLSSEPGNAEALEIATRAQQSSIDDDATGVDLWARRVAAHPSCRSLQDAAAFYRAHHQTTSADAVQRRLEGCAPESLDYAKLLSQQGSHARAAQTLQQLLAAAPLNRAARLMSIRELQLAGEDWQAQQAAVEWLHVAPNDERYHRLAAAVSEDEGQQGPTPFYAPYRRSASTIAEEVRSSVSSGAAVELLDDHVAISRFDGSVALYVHTVTRLGSDETAQQASNLRAPQGAEVLTLRRLRADGLTSQAAQAAENLVAGDIVESEYLVHYAGDSGIPEHPEVFQFVFGSFQEPVLNSRFVVLTPAEESDRGVVIATGGAPAVAEKIVNGMLQRVWSNDGPDQKHSFPAGAPQYGLPIVRVVEQENGWSVPSSAEHQRRIETIHPGPRPEDS
jgi:tetratricopeptide (TPR) repeat protein